MARQRPWIEDELILAADAMSRNGWRQLRAHQDVTREVSELLRTQVLHDEKLPIDEKFRSPNSVSRKSADMLSNEEHYAGRSTRGGQLDRLVMEQFRTNLPYMRAHAERIRDIINNPFPRPATKVDIVEADPGSLEGGIVERVVRTRERDRGLRQRKIEATVAAGIAVVCEPCGFDFGETYGPRGVGYIEVHHVMPLHVSGETMTELADLALVCANCHRMVHQPPWTTPDQLFAAIPIDLPPDEPASG